MANYTDLFNFENAVMSASMVILRANGVTSSYMQAGSTDLGTPRVELQSLTANPIGHVRNTASSGSQYDAFNGSLQVLVVTERALNASTHNTYKSKAISLLSNLRNFNTGSILPNHEITKIDFRSTNVRLDPAANLDFSALTMEYILWIRPTAWPN